MLKLSLNRKQSSLHAMLICLTVLFVAAQLSLFLVHYAVSELIDSLVNTSIALQLLHPVILIPVFVFVILQVAAYAIFVLWIWFISVSFGELLRFRKTVTYWLGLMIWGAGCAAILVLNKYYYPDSLFAKLLNKSTFIMEHNIAIIIAVSAFLAIVTLGAYINYFLYRRHLRAGTILLVLAAVMAVSIIYDMKLSSVVPGKKTLSGDKPNIILIGLDSLRPDFTHYYGNPSILTPNIDSFLQGSTVFNQAYTPLARTFPAWVSILTSKHPKHSLARNNLVDPANIVTNDTIAKRMREAGYETIYATDEKRFSNITSDYGFDRVVGPGMGVNDFLLGGLSDFPLSNLLVNLPFGRFLFPFNYGNRAAAITYEPDRFLQLVKAGLADRQDKPVFLAVHLCLSHWPFTWARDGQNSHFLMADQYRSAVQGVDRQLGELLQILKENGLLENSLVVLLSDHGTGLGLPGDRIISEKTYQGDPRELKLIQKLKLSSAQGFSTDKKDYAINTSYGQGTNVLGLKQYHVLLAFRRYGGQLPVQQINEPASLLDIAPTILDFQGFSPMNNIDGVSLFGYFSGSSRKPDSQRALFLETGDSMSEIETDHIYIQKVIKHEIGVYEINPQNGLLRMNPIAEKSVIKNKQLAVMWQGWYLARYPAHLEKKLVLEKGKTKSRPLYVRKSFVIPPYYVLANLKTGQWTIGLSSQLAKKAPVDQLLRRLKGLYGDEITS